MTDGLPNFLVIGAQKAGSTWLSRNLRQHPNIHMPQQELRFFTKEYHRGPDWYATNFADSKPGQIIGEGTPGYMFRPECVDRIDATLGRNIGLIASIREPGSRAYSSFWNLLGGGQLPADAEFLDAFEQDINGLRTRGHYAKQLAPFMDRFGRDHLMVAIMERDLGQTGPDTIARAFRFLGVDPGFRPTSATSEANVGASPRRGGAALGKLAVAASHRVDKLPPQLTNVARNAYRRAFAQLPVTREKAGMNAIERETVQAYYRDHISDLEDLLGEPLWRS